MKSRRPNWRRLGGYRLTVHFSGVHPGWPTPREIAALAERVPPSVLFGTSSWTYPGWTGLVYQRKYPAKVASAISLAEYARWPLVRTVGIDSFFYKPPTAATLKAYAAALPPGFRCVSKVWDEITAPTLSAPHYRERRGTRNADWLNAARFTNEVLGPMQENFGEHLGPLVFEFRTITNHEGCNPSQFVQALDRFLAALPHGVQYAVEVRNEDFLSPPYFAVLREHGVAHVFNFWTRMPPIGEQLLLHDAITADFLVARALVRPGRTFEQAVRFFEPYTHIQDENPALRNDLVALARTAINLRIPVSVIIGNRAEGCSPLTIAAVARLLVSSFAT